MSMADPHRQQPKKHGFFHRLSMGGSSSNANTASSKIQSPPPNLPLSPSHPPSTSQYQQQQNQRWPSPVEAQLPNGAGVGARGGHRAVSGPAKMHGVDSLAGPAYDVLPAGAAPSAYTSPVNPVDPSSAQRSKSRSRISGTPAFAYSQPPISGGRYPAAALNSTFSGVPGVDTLDQLSRFPIASTYQQQTYSRPPLLDAGPRTKPSPSKSPVNVLSSNGTGTYEGSKRPEERKLSSPSGQDRRYEVIASSSNDSIDRRHPGSPPTQPTFLYPPPIPDNKSVPMPRLIPSASSTDNTAARRYSRFEDADTTSHPRVSSFTSTFAPSPPLISAPTPTHATTASRADDSHNSSPPPYPSIASNLPTGAAPSDVPPVPPPLAQTKRSRTVVSARRSSSQSRSTKPVVVADKRHNGDAHPPVADIESLNIHDTEASSAIGGPPDPNNTVAAAIDWMVPDHNNVTVASPPQLSPAELPPRTSASTSGSNLDRQLSRPLPRPPSVVVNGAATSFSSARSPPVSPVKLKQAPLQQPQFSPSRDRNPNTSASLQGKEHAPNTTHTSPSTSRGTVHVIASSNSSKQIALIHSNEKDERTPLAPSSSDSNVLGHTRQLSASRPKIVIPTAPIASPPQIFPYTTPSVGPLVSLEPFSSLQNDSVTTAPSLAPAPSASAAATTSATANATTTSLTLPSLALPPRTPSKALANGKRASAVQLSFDFPRSPTLPPLEDPRLKPAPDPSTMQPSDPIERWAQDVATGQKVGQQPPVYPELGNGIPPVVTQSQLPPRKSSVSAQGRRIMSSPLSSPKFASPSSNSSSAFQSLLQPRAVSAPRLPSPVANSDGFGFTGLSILNRPRQRAKQRTLTYLLSHPPIAASFLPFLNINTFLNLLGSDDELRKYLTGEMIGRWVMREWGLTVDHERGRSWPGLTVWEGFLESLLHDPAVYSTYPAQYHSLLKHLSLSHTLVVLFLRNLPASAFPFSAPLPFDDELSSLVLGMSGSVGSFNGAMRPRSRMGSPAGSDAGSSLVPHAGKMPKQERVVEIIMPEPLAPHIKDDVEGLTETLAPAPSMSSTSRRLRRRGSISSIASVSSGALGFGRKRSNSTASVFLDSANLSQRPSSQYAVPVPQGKAALPPVSFPSAKRYGFRRHGDPAPVSRSHHGSDSRPGSIMSVQSSPSVGYNRSSTFSSRYSLANAPPLPGFTGISTLPTLSTLTSPDAFPVPPPIGGGSRPRSSLGSSEGRSSRRSDQGGGSNSPVQRRWDSPTQSSRDLMSQGASRHEPAFDRPPPYTLGRAPILRVFVPISDRVPRWPSADGAAACWRELEKCGATKRMRLGDLVVNTALRQPAHTEHVLVYMPFVQHMLVPLEYVHSATGHLPHYLDAFSFSPSYYYPFLPAPQIIYLDLAPFATQAMNSLRLAYDRRDVTVASGARLSAKRYLHVAGIEVGPNDRVAPEWQGMISLETEGTAEGKKDMEVRFGGGDPSRAVMGPWEVVRERSMLGTVWLRLVREK